LIQAINRLGPDFSIHVGGIEPSATPCSDEELRCLRQTFFTAGQSLGRRAMALESQPTLMPEHGKFVENALPASRLAVRDPAHRRQQQQFRDPRSATRDPRDVAVLRARPRQCRLDPRGNNWLRAGGNADGVYGYDAWSVPLEAAA